MEKEDIKYITGEIHFLELVEKKSSSLVFKGPSDEEISCNESDVESLDDYEVGEEYSMFVYPSRSGKLFATPNIPEVIYGDYAFSKVVKVEEDINKVKYLNINIASGNKINTDEVKTITVNDVVFDAKKVIKKLSLNNSALLSANEKASVDVISMTDPEVINAALLKNPIEVMITFTDDSSISRNMDVKMPDSYKEGDY